MVLSKPGGPRNQKRFSFDQVDAQRSIACKDTEFSGLSLRQPVNSYLVLS
jgi:hypothetical protein